WDPTRSFQENLERIGETTLISAGTGGVMGGVMTFGMKALGFGAGKIVESYKGWKVKFNPDAEIMINGEKLASAAEGRVTTIGKGNFEELAPGAKVSDNHITLTRDENGQAWVKNNSPDGTYIKRAYTGQWQKISADEVTMIGKGDEIHLGSPDGPQLEI